MLNTNDIKNITFKRSGLNGYKATDVDEFVDEVEKSFLAMQNEKLELISKIKFLADKINKYREEEESVRTALINAQILADNSIKDAKKRSEIILHEAQLESERVLRDVKADIVKHQKLLDEVKKNIKDFRASLLSMYKEHIKMINDITSDERFSEDNVKEVQNKSVEKRPQEDHVNVASKVNTTNKFSNLKFGEEYDVSKDESPIGLFK